MSTTQEQQRIDRVIEQYLAETRKAGVQDADALVALALYAFRRVTE